MDTPAWFLLAAFLGLLLLLAWPLGRWADGSRPWPWPTAGCRAGWRPSRRPSAACTGWPAWRPTPARAGALMPLRWSSSILAIAVWLWFTVLSWPCTLLSNGPCTMLTMGCGHSRIAIMVSQMASWPSTLACTWAGATPTRQPGDAALLVDQQGDWFASGVVRHEPAPVDLQNRQKLSSLGPLLACDAPSPTGS